MKKISSQYWFLTTPEVAVDEYYSAFKKYLHERGMGNDGGSDSISAEERKGYLEWIHVLLDGGTLKNIFALEEKGITEKTIKSHLGIAAVVEMFLIIDEQRRSFQKWVDYFSTKEARKMYPDWLRYWILGNVIGLGRFHLDHKVFSVRDERTIDPFPALDKRALQRVRDLILADKRSKKKIAALQKDFKDKTQRHPHVEGEVLILQNKTMRQSQKMLHTFDFAMLYAQELAKQIPKRDALLKNTQGAWVKYEAKIEDEDVGSHMLLVQSLESHDTGWPLASPIMAEFQLSMHCQAAETIHIYYSRDGFGKNTIPRVMIREVHQEGVDEVWGIAEDKELDPYIIDIAMKKIDKLGSSFGRRMQDMKMLTLLEEKITKKELLTKADLLFLYEINGYILSFSSEKDPRINRLRSLRNIDEDVAVMFGCTKEDIAHTVKQITKTTKVYIGNIKPDTLTRLPHSIQHIFSSFPDRKICTQDLRIGGKTEIEFKNLLKRHKRVLGGLNLNPFYEKWKVEPARNIKIINLYIKDLRPIKTAKPGGKKISLNNIYQRAKEFGLELCPADVGPLLAVQGADQFIPGSYRIAMIPFLDRDVSVIFSVQRRSNGALLYVRKMGLNEARDWDANGSFIFVIPEKKSEKRLSKKGSS